MSARPLRRAAFAIAWVAVSANATSARAQAAPTAEPKALPSIQEWKLKNGLTVAHVERSGLPMVTVQVWYRFGSADEPAGQHGAARMFERLMFLGSARMRPEEHRAYIEQVGGETGALVTEDVSAFHDTVPVERLDLALELEAERMRGLLIREDGLEALRPVMADEVRRQEGSPVFRAYQRLLSLAFTVHPYAWAPLGVSSEIQKLTTAQVKSLYDAYFVPSNALVVVVGGVPADTVNKAVERWFGSIPTAPAPAHPGAGKLEPAQTEPRRQELPGSAVGVVMAGYRLPAATDADVLPLQVAGVILTGGRSSRLHRRLIEGKLADEIGGQVLVRHDAGLLVAFARFAAGAAAPVEKALVGEIEKLAAQGPTAAELKRAKGQMLGAAWLGVESATGLANQIGVSWGVTGKMGAFLADLAALEKLGAADVRRAAAKYLAHAQQIVVTAEPGGGARPAGGSP